MKEKRKKEILDYVSLEGTVSISKLSDVFGVSPMTIRRDLAELEKHQLITKVPGGVAPVEGRRKDPPYRVRMYENAREKERIAEAAEALVKDGDLIFLDLGTTCLQLAKRLGQRKVTVVTNWLPNMLELVRGGICEVFNTGGQINDDELSSVGVKAYNAVSEFSFDKAFISVGAIDDECASDYRMQSVEIKRRVIECSRETIVVADHSKFGQKAPVRIVPLTSIQKIVVCDISLVNGRLLRKLANMGLKIIPTQEDEKGTLGGAAL